MRSIAPRAMLERNAAICMVVFLVLVNQAQVGFSLRIVSVESKLKLNQHRPEAHAAMHATYAAGNAQEQALAGWMKKLGLV